MKIHSVDWLYTALILAHIITYQFVSEYDPEDTAYDCLCVYMICVQYVYICIHSYDMLWLFVQHLWTSQNRTSGDAPLTCTKEPWSLGLMGLRKRWFQHDPLHWIFRGDGKTASRIEWQLDLKDISEASPSFIFFQAQQSGSTAPAIAELQTKAIYRHNRRQKP